MPPTALLLLLAGLLASSASAGSEADDLLAHGVARYSQGREEVLIRHFFADRREGFFLDVGAFHWRHLSTTYFLEHHLGWSGIAIDANGEFAEGYAKRRPRTAFFQYIVTDHSGAEESFYRADKVAKGLSSTSREWVERLTEQFFPDLESPVEEIRVPTITLDQLLEERGVEKIDFLSMDIEGGEVAALAGFDLRRFGPELVCVEGDPEVLGPYFERQGYERIEAYRPHDANNLYYRRKPEPPE